MEITCTIESSAGEFSHLSATADTYETALDTLRTQVPEGSRMIAIRRVGEDAG